MNMPAANSRPPIQKTARRLPGNYGVFAALALIGIAILGLYFVDVLQRNFATPTKPIILGVTFSQPYAESLGLDWKQTYLAILDELKVRNFRLSAYWDDIEPEPGVYNFKNLDWQVNEAARRGSRIILGVGRKLPRWPECHVPAWADGLSEPLVRSKLLAYVEAVVKHYADQQAIVMWQVENEPFFNFGICPKPDRQLLKQEIEVVKALDRRPVMVTESGELSTWIAAASLADVVGISTYRVVWSKYVGYFFWPITPLTYRERADAIRPYVADIIVSELQAEPWVTIAFDETPIDQQLTLMNPQRLSDNINFARRTGFSSAYLWGVEWWYWLKVHKRPEMWRAGIEAFKAGAGR